MLSDNPRESGIFLFCQMSQMCAVVLDHYEAYATVTTTGVKTSLVKCMSSFFQARVTIPTRLTWNFFVEVRDPFKINHRKKNLLLLVYVLSEIRQFHVLVMHCQLKDV